MCEQNEIGQLVWILDTTCREYGISSDQIYVFGSCVENLETANDIDLLIISSAACNQMVLRQRLEDLSRPLPIHLVIMSETESLELNFVTIVGAIPIKEFIQQTAATDTASRRRRA